MISRGTHRDKGHRARVPARRRRWRAEL